MKHKGSFTKIAKSEKRMYGPKGLLVCGYPEEERAGFIKLADKVGLQLGHGAPGGPRVSPFPGGGKGRPGCKAHPDIRGYQPDKPPGGI